MQTREPTDERIGEILTHAVLPEYRSKEFKENGSSGGKIELSRAVGMQLADEAKKKKITTAVFDRNGYRYHGRVKAVAEGARENGLKI